MKTLQQRYSLLQERIRAAAVKYGRNPEKICLLAVSKTRPVEDVVALSDLGQRNFGENYLQEAVSKIDATTSLPLTWHFIGPVQSNKTRLIAEKFHWLHSLDRLKLAHRLSEQRPADSPLLNVLVQVNISEEVSKSGVMPEEALSLCEAVSTLPGLRLRGLMAIPANSQDFEQQRTSFRALRELQDSIQASGLPLDSLSMGMSGDLEAAIAEGATIVRIGTDIFGPRLSGPATL